MEETKDARRRRLNREACARYKERHPDRYAAKLEKNRERCSARWKAWREAHPEAKSASRKWDRENPEKQKARNKRFRDKYPERVSASCKKFREDNPEYMREWHQKNAEKRKKQSAEWRAANRDKWRLYSHGRRAAKANGSGVPASRIEELFSLQKGKCAICSVSLKKAGHHIDHVEPISRGGVHATSNVQLLCPPCNLRKSFKDPIEHMRSLGRLL